MLFKKFNLYGNELILPVLCGEDNLPIIDKNKKYNEKGYIPDWNYANNIMSKSLSIKTDIPKDLTCVPVIKPKIKEIKDKKLSLNTSEWKEFKVGNIFKKLDIEKFNKEPEEGTLYNFVSASGLNNGVVKKVNKKSFDKPCLTITTDGACFDVFYQATPIAASVNVEILYSETLNKYSFLFIATILRMEQFKWSYGRKPKNAKVFETYIKLPIKKDKNNIPYIDEKKTYSEIGFMPDWEFMEEYIKSLNYRLPKTNNSDCPDIKLNLFAWKDFKLENILTIITLPSLNINKAKPGKYPYITRTALNNGLAGYYGNKDRVVAGNCLTIGREGRCAFYQPDDFIPGVGLCSLTNEYMNKYIGFFFVALLNKSIYRYSYGRARSINKIKKEIVKLPIKRNIDGTPCIDKKKKYSKEGYVPDWEFMEEYIKLFPYGDIIE